VERVTRIELALSAWEADVLPLNYTRERPPEYLADLRLREQTPDQRRISARKPVASDRSRSAIWDSPVMSSPPDARDDEPSTAAAMPSRARSSR
jgi:hypothetical protein